MIKLLVGILIVLTMFNLYVLDSIVDISMSLLLFVVGIVAVIGLYNDIKNVKRWK